MGFDPPVARTAGSAERAELEALITAIPEGWSHARINGHSWGVTRKTRADGKTISLDAERLGSAEALGANVWLTSRGAVLRPCEIPAETVLQFLRDAARENRCCALGKDALNAPAERCAP
jgi:peptide-methionine (S)-S-oxide reductase